VIDVEPHMGVITSEAKRFRRRLPPSHPIEVADLVAGGALHVLESLRMGCNAGPALVRVRARQGMLHEIQRWDHGTKEHPVNQRGFVAYDESDALQIGWMNRATRPLPIELMIDLLRELLKLRLSDSFAWVSRRLCDDDHEVAARELREAPDSMKNRVTRAETWIQAGLREYEPRPAKTRAKRAEELLRRGDTVPSVAKALHIDDRTLYALQDRIDPTAKKRRAAQARQMRAGREEIATDDLVTLRADGMTLAAIAEHFGCSMQLVRKRLKKLGMDTSRIDGWHRRSAA
jgi:DNA invertase Pin-like site-specific DNA recombinase